MNTKLNYILSKQDFIAENSSEKVWYHGTPDCRKLEEEGGFTERFIHVTFVEDPQALKEHLIKAREFMSNGDENVYFKMLDEVNNFKVEKKLRSPVFFTDIASVAKTYADPKRSFDYQNAQEKVYSAHIKPKQALVITAIGERFRQIPLVYVRNGFLKSGISESDLDLAISQYCYHDNLGKGISTNSIAAIADHFGFDTIDVVGVLDSYMGGTTRSTVRMVFDVSDIQIIKN